MAEKILVVDDEPAVASVITECLESAGFAPETSTDSVAALGRISAAVYDLIVSDIAMPGLTGLQLLAVIKARSPSPEVILVTAFSTADLAAEALAHGAFGYLQKPFDTAELLERVKQALWKRRVTAGQKS